MVISNLFCIFKCQTVCFPKKKNNANFPTKQFNNLLRQSLGILFFWRLKILKKHCFRVTKLYSENICFLFIWEKKIANDPKLTFFTPSTINFSRFFFSGVRDVSQKRKSKFLQIIFFLLSVFSLIIHCIVGDGQRKPFCVY